MNYLELSVDTWSSLQDPDPETGGYPSVALSIHEDEPSGLHLFRDGSGYYHLAIEAPEINIKDIEDPHVNGLEIQEGSYRFEDGNIGKFIDLICSYSSYLNEFTEVVREVSRLILEDEEQPLNAVNQIINNWISFWANQRKETLREEDQVGLICELITLNRLCEINSENALKTWVGPLGEKHDFNLSDWNFEVKGTRKLQRIHTINGIDQLKSSYNKRLAFVSFHLTTSANEQSINLPCLIQSLIKNHFEDKPNLIVRFNELLASAGYSPVHAEEYKKFNVEVMESTFFEVDDAFPKLTSAMLNEPLNSRVSSVRYDISLNSASGQDFSKLDLRTFFH